MCFRERASGYVRCEDTRRWSSGGRVLRVGWSLGGVGQLGAWGVGLSVSVVMTGSGFARDLDLVRVRGAIFIS